MYDGIVFDMASFSEDELKQMVVAAAKCRETVFEVISELSEWIRINQAESIGVNWASDRALARRRSQREAYLFKAKDILLKNKDFLEKVTAALIEKETLLYSDVKALRESVTITEVAV